MKRIIPFMLLLFIFAGGLLHAQDWPIYKGNIYFTGNNDEIVVKNANLKWLYQANDRTFNPIASDGRIYFLDQNADLYALDEEYGRLQWKVDFQKISSQFKAFSKSAGKVKYPLIKDNTIFLTDPIAIYALDKRNGAVLWARTGMRTEELPKAAGGLSGRTPLPQVDGIYADPVIQENNIYYGTRNMFLSREIRNGHEGWENLDIKTYSAYPTFYDDKIITQSMDYKTNIYSIYCLDAASGKQVWIQTIEKPQRIFPPVVYNQKVYVPTNKSIYCLDYKTGSKIWSKDYGRFVTSNPSFTDRAILFTLDNSDMAVVSPENGSILSSVSLGQGSSPYFITVRDNLYLAYNEKKTVNGKDLTFGTVKAINFNDNSTIWTFNAPFPGSVSQPVASKGILFLPSGNYVYAIGTEYYAKVVQGGEGYAVVDKKPGPIDDTQKKKMDNMLAQLDPKKTPEKTPDKNPPANFPSQEKNSLDDQNKPVEEKKLAMKPLTVTV